MSTEEQLPPVALAQRERMTSATAVAETIARRMKASGHENATASAVIRTVVLWSLPAPAKTGNNEQGNKRWLAWLQQANEAEALATVGELERVYNNCHPGRARAQLIERLAADTSMVKVCERHHDLFKREVDVKPLLRAYDRYMKTID